MVLLSPSAKGLNKLLVICKEYASKHDIIYNTSKTKVMLFPCKSFVIAPALPVHIGDVSIEWVVEYLYLGYVIVPSLDDDRDIERNMRSICIRANMLSRQFSLCSHSGKILLFKAYCGNMYCAHLWVDYSIKSITKMKICYNNAFRRMFHLDRFCSASGMFANFYTPSFGEIVIFCVMLIASISRRMT